MIDPTDSRSSNRLQAASLESLPASVVRPRYRRQEHKPGIVHLGTGAFHRAHQAVYTDTALGAEGGDWRIIGASLRSRSTCDPLNRQGGLYTVVSRDVESEEFRVIGALDRVLFAPDDPAALIDVIASADTRIVSLTVTEKGYCYNPASSSLDTANELIKSDLLRPDSPRSAPGFIVAGLQSRRRSDAGPVTVLSCDNLPDNGVITRTVVLELADRIDPELTGWIERNVSFPCSMVDRITPATTDAGRQYVAQSLGVVDECPVLTESFSQWVIEDRFATGRPAWEAGGALFVTDVAPFEKMKLRLLNGSHSAIAYLGYLAGFEYVHDVIANPPFRDLIRVMMDTEVTPTLEATDFDVDAYKDELIRRFANPNLNHQTRQIAMDGSQKLPQRLLEPISERLSEGKPIHGLALAVAAWMRYVTGQDDAGTTIDVDDPLAKDFARIRRDHAEDPAAIAEALMAIRPVFGEKLPTNPAFWNPVTESLTQLMQTGVMATFESTLKRVNGRLD